MESPGDLTPLRAVYPAIATHSRPTLPCSGMLGLSHSSHISHIPLPASFLRFREALVGQKKGEEGFFPAPTSCWEMTGQQQAAPASSFFPQPHLRSPGSHSPSEGPAPASYVFPRHEAPTEPRPSWRTKRAPAERGPGVSSAEPCSEALVSRNTTSSHLLPSPVVAARLLISGLPQHSCFPFYYRPPTTRPQPPNTFVINYLYYISSDGNSSCDFL